MASDLSSVPLSAPTARPRAATAVQPTTTSPRVISRRPSEANGPPLIALSPTTYAESPPDHGIAGIASGPLRHPKPLTPSDLHSVNRLSRELSLLRQQTTSVASTTSSTSGTLNDSLDALHSSPYLNSSTNHSTSRRHRSSSSLSSSYVPAVQGSRTNSVTGIAPLRDSGLPIRPGRSRETSITSPRQSDAALSSLSPPLQQQGDYFPHVATVPSSYPHRNSITQPGKSAAAAMSRYEETAHHRAEYESIKRENEALRRRVRDLEQVLKKHRDGEPKMDDLAHGSTSALTNAMKDASIAETS
ncbi:hypothetical protein ASPWEDRAFT_176254 [Aspergillus wentii DTO 134E9]|uniref:Uncharacterized protein n=1 Tax=Aspergillus wentii DTO 134E9 TaxID=1073089 RepID=A0A1L9R8A2_ASPWE|nr:uncharacterized protein ASPWEDRAFT_176254 [Aspergillus wentii DTO 134E9]OJJ31155.1 hypothetical protein ASPWEDRAFT_176254 [Aspergillus wentii DTO 134E9]